MLRGVRADLGAVQGHVAQPHQASPPTQGQHLLKQGAQRRQMAAPKRGDGAEVWSLQRRDRHEVHPLLAGPRDAARGVDPLAVGVQQQRCHHDRVVRRIAALLVVRLDDRRQIQFLGHRVPYEVRQMVRRHEVQHRGRQQQLLLDVPLAKGLSHSAFNQSRPCGVHAFSNAAGITGTDS